MGVTPSDAAPGDTNLSDATVSRVTMLDVVGCVSETTETTFSVD